MVRKNIEKMKENLEKEINGFIMGGLNGGFQFDEEQAQYLQELQDMMIYIFEKQDNMIDQESQAFEFMRHTAETRKEQIKKLEEENKQVKAAYDDRCDDIDSYNETFTSIAKVLLSCSKRNDKLKEIEEIVNGSLADIDGSEKEHLTIG